MAAPTSGQEIFDVRRIRRLIELMKEHELSEMDLQQGDTRIQLRRDLATLRAPPASPLPAGGGTAPDAPLARAVAAPATESTAGDHVVVIQSPMVGTFYTAPDPDSPPYVNVGDRVDPDTTICIVEAMKVFNEIPAEVAGTIVAVLADNGDSVEYGQPLFKVDTRR